MSNCEPQRQTSLELARLDRFRQAKVTEVHILRSEVAGILDHLCAQTGDPAYARAARTLFQQSPGRRPIDDRRAVQDAEELFKQGKARSRHDARMQVASSLAPYGTWREWCSIAERLRKKSADEQKVST
jgi:hypothetical protein